MWFPPNCRIQFMQQQQQLPTKEGGTVYPKKYAHGFCFAVLCCGYTLTDFPISIRLTSLALWQSNDCPSASKATQMNMDKYFMWIHYERLHNHNKAKHNKTVCIFLGIYCITSDSCIVQKCKIYLKNDVILRFPIQYCQEAATKWQRYAWAKLTIYVIYVSLGRQTQLGILTGPQTQLVSLPVYNFQLKKVNSFCGVTSMRMEKSVYHENTLVVRCPSWS